MIEDDIESMLNDQHSHYNQDVLEEPAALHGQDGPEEILDFKKFDHSESKAASTEINQLFESPTIQQQQEPPVTHQPIQPYKESLYHTNQEPVREFVAMDSQSSSSSSEEIERTHQYDGTFYDKNNEMAQDDSFEIEAMPMQQATIPSN